ncbi:MAG: DVU0298 family protein [Desulfobacteraceae bacterium]
MEEQTPGGGRVLKQRVMKALSTGREAAAMEVLAGIPPKRLVSPLFGALHRMEPRTHWTAVRVMGAVVALIAERDMEGARVVIRRMMWNLNDESGGIGWGCPEAMGEALARNRGLGEEYTKILASYTRKDGNFLEHEPLQKGLLWGLVRMAGVDPVLIKGGRPDAVQFLESPQPVLRGLAARLAGLARLGEAAPLLRGLLSDPGEITEDLDGILPSARVRDLAQEALKAVEDYRPDWH